jgi:Ni,Fe-hydrogenase maturation factor
MNERLRQFERESKLEIFGLGARQEKWEAALEKYAELIIRDCVDINKQELSFSAFEKLMNKYHEHFGVEQ